MVIRVFTKFEKFDCDEIQPVFENGQLIALDLSNEEIGFIIRVYSEDLVEIYSDD